MLTVLFFGTGSAFSKEFGHTNALVTCDDTRLFIDLGYVTPSRMMQYQQYLHDIDYLAISHIHADHIGGLEELAFSSYFEYKLRPTLLLPGRLYSELWTNSLRGGLEWIADENGDASQCTLETFFRVIQLEEGWFEIGSILIKAFAVDHVPGKTAFGFLVKEKASAQTFVFSCDIRATIPELLSQPIHPDFVSGPIFHDCQFGGNDLTRVHCSIDEILTYPASLRQRIFIVHYNEDPRKHLSIINAAGLRVMWPGTELTMADLLPLR